MRDASARVEAVGANDKIQFEGRLPDIKGHATADQGAGAGGPLRNSKAHIRTSGAAEVVGGDDAEVVRGIARQPGKEIADRDRHRAGVERVRAGDAAVTGGGPVLEPIADGRGVGSDGGVEGGLARMDRGGRDSVHHGRPGHQENLIVAVDRAKEIFDLSAVVVGEAAGEAGDELAEIRIDGAVAQDLHGGTGPVAGGGAVLEIAGVTFAAGIGDAIEPDRGGIQDGGG